MPLSGPLDAKAREGFKVFGSGVERVPVSRAAAEQKFATDKFKALAFNKFWADLDNQNTGCVTITTWIHYFERVQEQLGDTDEQICDEIDMFIEDQELFGYQFEDRADTGDGHMVKGTGKEGGPA